MNAADKKLLNARIQASLKLQHLCFDAAHKQAGAFVNRDRAMDVVDAIVTCVLETLNQYIEEKDHAAHNNK